MERIQRNCRELMKIYKLEDINSSKAASFRKKIFRVLKELESEGDGNPKAVELFWRTAYYDAISMIRSRGDDKFLDYMANIFIGEISSFIAAPSRNVAHYYIMLGDLMRYIQSPLFAVQYRKSLEANPELGKPLNQLALQEKGIKAIRLFLLSIAAKEHFKSAVDNLTKAIEEPSDHEILSLSKNIIKYSGFEKKRQELSSEFIKFVDLIDESNADDSYMQDNLPLIVHSLVVAHDIVPHRLGDDYFITSIISFCELFTLLLKKFREINENKIGGQRRRNLSSGSNKSGSGSDEDDPDEISENMNAIFWPISVCCQWTINTMTHINSFNKDVTPIPASVRETLHSLIDKLIERLNELLNHIPLKDDGISIEEISWLLNGPVNNQLTPEKREEATKQLAYWTEMLISCPETDIEFAAYFRRRKTDTSITKKMGMLHVEVNQLVKKDEDNVWIPVFVIPDYSVMEKHLHVLRTITSEDTVIPVVPSFVLAELDRMKSTGPKIRDAMRFIERQQAKGKLRVVSCKTYLECAEDLTKNVDIDKIEGPLTGLLTTDKEKHKDVVLRGLNIYHIKDFLECWKRTYC